MKSADFLYATIWYDLLDTIVSPALSELDRMVLLIGANGLAVDYGGRTIFSEVSLDVLSGERIGVVGENGAGKSTLLRVLAGQEPPDEGQVVYSKGLRLGFLVQEPHFPEDQTVYEAVAGAHAEVATLALRLARIEATLAGVGIEPAHLEPLLEEYGTAQHRFEELGGYEHEARVLRVLEGLGFRDAIVRQPAERLSGGQKKLIGLARLLVTKPDVLLLDEPDNHLDFEGKTFLETYINEYPGAVLVISHDRYLLDRVARRIVEVEDGAIASWVGGYTAYVEQKEAHLLRMRELYQVQQEALHRQEEAMYRLVQWARQNPKFAGRAENMKKQVERKREEMMDRPMLVRRRITLDFGQHDGSRKVVTAHDLTVRVGAPPPGAGRTLLREAAFAVAFGERVGIVGPNGSGKSTLLKLIVGQIEPAGGELRLGLSVRLGYYAQEQETLPAGQTPLEWIRQQKALTEQAGISRLRRLLLTYEDMHAPIARLSGGQKSRLQFERLMLGDYNLLVLDEPTNNIDIASAEVLESALQEFQGTAIIVSHDRYLLDNAVDRILELPGDGTVREFLGNYSYYLEHRALPSPPDLMREEPSAAGTGDAHPTHPDHDGMDQPKRPQPAVPDAHGPRSPARPSGGTADAPGRASSAAPDAPRTPGAADTTMHASQSLEAPSTTGPVSSANTPAVAASTKPPSLAAERSGSTPASRAASGATHGQRPVVRRVRLALLGMPGVGKRTLLAELAAPARNDQQPPARSAEPGTIRLADGL
ncbi:MAG TPA: ATP-binding cassette domain-containing protein, partial [Ktedonobacterales bacterium]|nr:ATP-binding cassette domain-containing protein [Ktedonobacterales bacterium]